MSVYTPESVSSLGKDVWTWLNAAANRAAVSLASEINAASSCNFQMAARPGIGISGETGRVDDPRHGASVTYESPGITKYTLGTITFLDRPQDAAAATNAKHRDAMVENAVGFVLNRRGLGSSPENWQAWAAAQRYWLYPVICGPQIPIAPGEEGGQFEYTQDLFIIGPRVAGIVAA